MRFSLLQCLVFYVTLVPQVCNSQNCTTQNMHFCIFPFKFKNRIYSACNTEKVKPGRSWCSLKVDSDGRHLKGKRKETWDFCSTDCPVEGYSKCKGDAQCMNQDDCPQYKEFMKIPRSLPEYQNQRNKWIASICNRKEKKLCCNYPANYLPRSGQCGKNRYITQVSGGVNARLNEFPWAVLLGYHVKKRYWDFKTRSWKVAVSTEYRCGGTLINTRYVLTAAHCHQGNNRVSTVILGEWEVGVDPDCPIDNQDSEECNPKRQVKEVENVTIHESYINNKKSGELINDIALIRLRQPAILNDAIQLICLPLNEEQTAEDIGAENLMGDIIGRNATVIGWGTTRPFQGINSTLGAAQNILQKVDIPIVSNEYCKSRLSKLTQEDINVIIGPKHICAGKKGSNKDSCKGDSGGGMFIKKDEADDITFYQIGLVSFGLSQCGIGYSGVYTRITEFIPWIIQNVHI